METKGLSAATVLRIHPMLSRALKVAVQRGVASTDVVFDPPAEQRGVEM